MLIPRIFQAVPLTVGELITLTDPAAHHLARVLRAALQDDVILFNGCGGEYSCTIAHIDKKTVKVRVNKFNSREAESPLELCLVQGISRGEKMDYTIQKAVELGVKKIIPLFTERCNVRLDDERREKRRQHWQAIVVGACEQSGRNYIPEVLSPQSFNSWVLSIEEGWRFVLSPHTSGSLSNYEIPRAAQIFLLVGPEGGLSDQEMELAKQRDFLPLNLGPRILRTETAAIAAITAFQCCVGDMAVV